MRTVIKARLVAVPAVLSICLVAAVQVTALEPPPVIPVGYGWDTYWNSSLIETCCGKYTTVYTLDTSEARDYDATERQQHKDAFLSAYAGHVAFLGDATFTYNCHGYVFNNSTVWAGPPDAWNGTPEKNAYPCYTNYSSGTKVYRWGSAHSAFEGTGGYPYMSKCGAEILCLHD